MSMTRIIPCLDVQDGRVVKGIQFQDLRDAGDPVERASIYEAQGADELCLLDVSATPSGRGSALETVAKVRAVLGIPLTVGGGVRTIQDAERLLAAGADKIAVNTAALARPALLTEIRDQLGAQCTIVAIDAARTLRDPNHFEVVVRGGRDRTGKDAVQWAAEAVAAGAGEILATSWDRDGTGEGYDLDLLKVLAGAVSVPIIASGGAKTQEHMASALSAGASAVLAASIFHDSETTVDAMKSGLAGLGFSMRVAALPSPEIESSFSTLRP